MKTVYVQTANAEIDSLPPPSDIPAHSHSYSRHPKTEENILNIVGVERYILYFNTFRGWDVIGLPDGDDLVAGENDLCGFPLMLSSLGL
jgi:hypothetical protein